MPTLPPYIFVLWCMLKHKGSFTHAISPISVVAMQTCEEGGVLEPFSEM
jgi:hypothetical protein